MNNNTEGKTSQILSSRIKTVGLMAVRQSRFKAYNLKQLILFWFFVVVT